MARTTAERLTFWEDLRDDIEDAIAAALASGGRIVRYRVGTREVEKSQADATKDLLLAEETIARLTATTNAGNGRARSLIRFKRR
jgi:hypothetical protein